MSLPIGDIIDGQVESMTTTIGHELWRSLLHKVDTVQLAWIFTSLLGEFNHRFGFTLCPGFLMHGMVREIQQSFRGGFEFGHRVSTEIE